MSLFGKKEENEFVEERSQEVAAPAVNTSSVGSGKSGTTRIGRGISLIGDFETEDEVIIDGTVEGIILSKESLIVSEGGRYVGSARVRSLKVNGKVRANILSEGITEISNTGNYIGDLETAFLHSADGAKFDGKLKLRTRAEAAAAQREAAAKAASENSAESVK